MKTRWLRMAMLAGTTAMLLICVGDPSAATTSSSGVDPLEILDLVVRPNILLVFDTSHSMIFASEVFPGAWSYPVGGDDPQSRLYQAKTAVNEVVAAYKSDINFGLMHFPGLNSDKVIRKDFSFDGDSGGQPDGPLTYVSQDPAARFWYWNPTNSTTLTGTPSAIRGTPYKCPTASQADISGYFCGLSNTDANWNNPTDKEDIFRSFSNRGYHAMEYPINYTWDMTANGLVKLEGADAESCPEGASSCSGGLDQFHRPICNPANGECRFYLGSRIYRSGTRYIWNMTNDGTVTTANKLVNTIPITCPTPPNGLTSTNGQPRACIQFARSSYSGAATASDNTNTEIATFYYTSLLMRAASVDCDDAPSRVENITSCWDDNTPTISNGMRLEAPLDTNGLIIDLNTTTYLNPSPTAPSLVGLNPSVSGAPPVVLGNAGIRASGGTPTPRSLYDIANADGSAGNPYFFPVFATGMKNYVLVLTDGAANCARDAAYAGREWIEAAVYAQQLFTNFQDASDTIKRKGAETLVIAFTNNAIGGKSDVIALAGSGGTVNTTTDTVSCTPSTTNACRNAYRATTYQQLKQALRDALETARTPGEFSSGSSITDSIYEYAALTTGVEPNSGLAYRSDYKQTRYETRVPVFVQTSFDIPGYKGHVTAYVNISGTMTELWDAGQKLLDRVPTFSAQSFAALHASATPATIRTSAALIKRRIYTTARNGVFPYGSNVTRGATQTPVPIWPPTTSGAGAVAPNDDTTAGVFDDAMGIGPLSTTVLTFAQLQQPPYNACRGTTVHAKCQDADPDARLKRARREARETILAYTAGAELNLDTSGVPTRDGSTLALRYNRRAWLLAESTNASPAIITPPPADYPEMHTGEWSLFINNPSNSTSYIDEGYGMRNPEYAGGSGTAFMPVMSVIYYAANDMLHAFRAGPKVCTAPGSCPTSSEEAGGHELWGFVPFDQLDKLKERMLSQGRYNHTYMVASSVRFMDIFVPAPTGFTVAGRSYMGKWRTVIVFGRGPGGKAYTALDVTAPGPFNRWSLDTNEPYPLWNRGNPDTQDGKTGGPANYLTNTGSTVADAGVNDATAYATMGQTWSVPALARVPEEYNDGKEFMAFMGSGYSDSAGEGKTFYAADALTGDIFVAATVPNSTGLVTGNAAGSEDCGANATCAPPANAIVASPAAYISARLRPTAVPNPAASLASMIYVGDIHGRLWKFITSSPSQGLIQFIDLSVDQPVASAVGMLEINSKPHIYAETGFDSRIVAPPNFQMWALRDEAGDINREPNTHTKLYMYNFGPMSAIAPSDTRDFSGYRGTAQPATAFNTNKMGRVFFIGTKKVQDTSLCRYRFDSVLFALTAVNGQAAYDLNANASTSDMALDLQGKYINAVRGSAGKIVLDTSQVSGTPPLPPTPGAWPSAIVEGRTVNITRYGGAPAVCTD